MMNRRAFIAGTASTAASPVVALGQQSERVRRIGVLMRSPENNEQGRLRVTSLREALGKLGWSDGQNAFIEVKWGES